MSVVDYISKLPLTKASMTFNGERLEKSIPGYRTIEANGRDSMQQDLEEIDSKVADGTIFRSKKVLARDIEVTFVLIRETPEDLHKAYNKLKGLLFSYKEAKIIFNDEPDVYYIGTVTNIDSENIVMINDSQGTFTIHCSDPFKYGLNLISVEPDSNGQFVIDYDGYYKSYPIITAEFNGDCGYIGFTNGNGALQFGDVDQLDTGRVETNTKEQVLYFKRGNISEAMLNSFEKNKASVIKLGCIQNGTLESVGITRRNVPLYDGQGREYATGNYVENVVGLKTRGAPGASAIWNGAGFSVHLNADSGGSRTAKDFFALGQIEMSAMKDTSHLNTADPTQVGMIQFVVSTESKQPILGIVFLKNNQSTDCEIRLYIGTTNGDAVEIVSDRMNTVSNKNLNVMPNSRNNKYLYWDHGDFSMSKIGDKIDFFVDHKHHTFDSKAIPQIKTILNYEAAYINFFIAGLDTTGVKEKFGVNYKPLGEAYIRGFGAEKYNATTIKDIANTFMKNNVLEVNTGEGTAKIDGILRNDIGAIGNEWDKVYLSPGRNIIDATYSRWVTSSNKPKITLKYRKVFI